MSTSKMFGRYLVLPDLRYQVLRMIDEDVAAGFNLLRFSRNYPNFDYLTRTPDSRSHSFLWFAYIPINATVSRKRVIDWTLEGKCKRGNYMRQDSICIPRVITLLQNCIAKILGFLPHVYTEMHNGTLRMRMTTVPFSFFLLFIGAEL